MSAYFKRATAVSNYVFFMVNASNRPVGLTGASPAVTVSKDGGAFAAVAGSVTEIASGFYKVALSAAETDARILAVRATAASADPWNDIQLLDTKLVSEVSVGGLLGGGSSGDSVWSAAEKERLLSQVKDIRKAVKEQAGALTAASEAILARINELSAALTSARGALELAVGQMDASGQRSAQVLQAELTERLEALSPAIRAVKGDCLSALSHAGIATENRIKEALQELGLASAALSTIKERSDYTAKLLTAMAGSEQLIEAEEVTLK